MLVLTALAARVDVLHRVTRLLLPIIIPSLPGPLLLALLLFFIVWLVVTAARVGAGSYWDLAAPSPQAVRSLKEGERTSSMRF